MDLEINIEQDKYNNSKKYLNYKEIFVSGVRFEIMQAILT